MKCQHPIVLCVLGALLLAPHSGECSSRVEGIARALPEGNPIYSETHEFDGNAHRIEYRDTGGVLIAEKQLDYACSDSAPDWQQHDLRSGARVGGRWSDAGYVLQRDDRSSTITPEGTLVASSGFDHFVRQHWEELRTGNTVGFEFAVPARLTTIGMRIQKTRGLPGEREISEWFEAEPSSGLFRLFAGSILLGYDKEGTLQFYRGPSNIGDGKGRGLEVEIRYRRLDTGQQREPALAGDRNDPQLQCPRRDA